MTQRGRAATKELNGLNELTKLNEEKRAGNFFATSEQVAWL
jgi:hypothetical protein